MRFDQRYQVKQFVAVVQSNVGCKFAVFKTGDEKFYLFRMLKDGCGTDICFPVEKKQLRNDIKRALANGCGNALWG